MDDNQPLPAETGITTTILVVDDDEAITRVLRLGLHQQGYGVLIAADGDSALRICAQQDVDLVILDINLPRVDGLEVCQRLREQSDVLVLMLSARDTTSDRVLGLRTGADDYLTKPFDFDELSARVAALLRRRLPSEETVRCEPFVLNNTAKEVTRDGTIVGLTPREYAIFEVLMRNPRQTLSREIILQHAWDEPADAAPTVIDVHIRSLREKLDPEHRHITTVRGFGYRLIPRAGP